MNVYHLASLSHPLTAAGNVPDGVTVRPINQADLMPLAGLYALAYDLGPSGLTVAVGEMESAFDGAWGALWPEASLVAWARGKPIGVVQTVHRPAMDDAPDCPWLIEVFTDPEHRRAGLTRKLMARACAVVRDAGHKRVGLTVDTNNDPALSLYQSLGFVPAD